MYRYLSTLCVIFLLPLGSLAQVAFLENGQALPQDANIVACSETKSVCSERGCEPVCTSYLTLTGLTNFLNSQSTRSSNIEASITAVRQDLQPSISAQATEINNLKSNLSNAELQRMIQKIVREELNQRGL